MQTNVDRASSAPTIQNVPLRAAPSSFVSLLVVFVVLVLLAIIIWT